MNLKELSYITTVAETGNISKAAEKLYISQSSLSRCVQKIEGDLGVELFRRTPEGLKVTVAGEYYIESAHKILQTYKEMENQVSRLSSMKSGRLVVGTTTILGSFALPSILSVFLKIYPNIDISIIEGTSMDVENELIRGSVDLGLLHTPMFTNSLEHQIIARERFLLAVPPDDVLNDHADYGEGGKYIDIRLTANRNYILTHPSQRTRQLSDNILRQAGITPRLKYKTKSIQTASRLVAAGLGVTLVPHSYSALFKGDLAPKYYRISEELNPYWSLVSCYNPDLPLTKPAEEFSRIAEDIMPSLFKDYA